MTDNELGGELRAEVPKPSPGYWSTIDDRLAAAAGEIGPASVATPIGTDDADASGVAASARRPRWPLAVAAALVLIAGLAIGTRLATDETVDTGFADDPATIALDSLPGPLEGLDHWHSVYGVWDCTADDGSGAWLAPFESTRDDTGIHSHGDGLIHIHPFFERSAGLNAVFGHFADEMGFEVTDTAMMLDDGRVLSEATTTCSGEAAVLHLRRWQSDVELLADPATPPRIITENIEAERFYNDREVWTLAFAPLDADLPLPPSTRFDTLVQHVPALDFDEAESGQVDPAPIAPTDQLPVADQAIKLPTADFYGNVRAPITDEADIAQTFEGQAADFAPIGVVPGSAIHRATATRNAGDLHLIEFLGSSQGDADPKPCIATMVDGEIVEIGCGGSEGPDVSWGQAHSVRNVWLARLPGTAQLAYVRTSEAKTILVDVVNGMSYVEWEASVGEIVSVRVVDVEGNEVWSSTNF